jgi:DNA recombination protein RmuC
MASAALILLGIALGAAAGWLIARGRAGGELAAARAALELERRSAAEKIVLLEQTKAGLETTFSALSAQALQQNNQSFMALAKHELAPIRDSLEKVDRQAQELERARRQAYGALNQQLVAVAEGQDKLRTETGNLVTALRAPHVRGRWGETQLRRVLELAGMMEHCDFVTQSSGRDDEGNLLRPDVIVRLPGGKQVVVDAKAPLAAYLEAVREDLDADARLGHLRDHARQVRDHVAKLSAKRYAQQFSPAPDFVIMFLPDETFLRAAHEVDSALSEDAWRVGVVLASPSNILTLLRSIALTWHEARVAESADQVNRLGRELYERLGTFAGHLRGVGSSLNSAVGAYNRAVGSLESRVLVTARKFPEHGVPGDELPELPPLEQQARPLQALELERGDAPALPRAVDAA